MAVNSDETSPDSCDDGLQLFMGEPTLILVAATEDKQAYSLKYLYRYVQIPWI